MFFVNNNFTHIIKNSYSTAAMQCYKTNNRRKRSGTRRFMLSELLVETRI